jgi:hypothetical protein
LGDANADWLAYGLEDAFSGSPNSASCGTARSRPDPAAAVAQAAAVAREVIAAEKPSSS